MIDSQVKFMHNDHQRLASVPRPAMNTYRLAAALIIERFQWDLSLSSWKHRKMIKKWSGKYSNKKAIIMCNGPSLKTVDLNLLEQKSIFTFGLNKINLLFDSSDFRPSCIVSVNPYVIKQNAHFFNKTQLPLFLCHKSEKLIKHRANIHYFHTINVLGSFARDCSWSINIGATVTYMAMQLAFYMGFSKVGLVGCDHYFGTQGPPNKLVKSGEKDSNHFDERYFSGGVEWQLPDLQSSNFHYSIARDTFNHFGKELVNCTEGGNLEVLKRQNLISFINS